MPAVTSSPVVGLTRRASPTKDDNKVASEEGFHVSPPSSAIRRGFSNRVPIFTKARKTPRPSMLDALDSESEIRKSQFWGVGKFVLVSLVYWMFSNLYRQYLDREYVLDSHLFHSMAKPFLECIGWWAVAILWSFNAQLNIALTYKSGNNATARIHRWVTELILLVGSVMLPFHDHMGTISSSFCFMVGNIYLMKVHSFIETNYDLIAQEAEDMDFQVPTIKEVLYFLMVPSLVYEPNFPVVHSANRYRNIAVRSIILCFTLLFSYVWLTEKCIPLTVQLHRMSILEGTVRALIPMWVTAMIIFYCIFEMICNLLADITGFADRQFYGDWWNSTTFEEFNRLWNKPVHEFLLRHVYLRYNARGYSKFWSSMITVGYSAVMHELALFVTIKELRFHFALLMMTQPFLFKIQNMTGMKGTQGGNIFFWAGLVFGISLACTYYGSCWALTHEEANVALGWLKAAR